MSKFSIDQISRINRKIDILEVFQYYGIEYEQDGSEQRYRTTCPFHADRSPSLKIYPETNSWYAYCCCAGYYAYDLIKAQEANEDAADEVALKLAKIKQYDDPIEEVLDILDEDDNSSRKRERLNVVYLISITLRDFLSARKGLESYRNLCSEVDKWFVKLDELLESDSTTEEDIKQFLTKVVEFTRAT